MLLYSIFLFHFQDTTFQEFYHFFALKNCLSYILFNFTGFSTFSWDLPFSLNTSLTITEVTAQNCILLIFTAIQQANVSILQFIYLLFRRQVNYNFSGNLSCLLVHICKIHLGVHNLEGNC